MSVGNGAVWAKSSGVRALNFTQGWAGVPSVLPDMVIKVPVMAWGELGPFRFCL